MLEGAKIKYGVECTSCGDQIFSKHRHDFRFCKCKKTFVDGGNEYLRYGGDISPFVIKMNSDGSVERVED